MKHWKLNITNKLARLTICTDKKGNRLTPDTFYELNEVLSNLNFEEVRGLILDNEGDDFSQGFDLSFLLSSQEQIGSSIENVFSICNEALDRLYDLPIPTISFVKGACIGGGFLMTLATDFRVADENSKFGFPEVKQSLIVNLGLKRVYDLLGEIKTKELVLLGDPVSANKMLGWGAVNWLAVGKDFEPFSQKFSNYINFVPPLAVKYNKELIHSVSNLTYEQSTVLENNLQKRVFQTADFKEAIESFLEKRVPDYKGQ